MESATGCKRAATEAPGRDTAKKAKIKSEFKEEHGDRKFDLSSIPAAPPRHAAVKSEPVESKVNVSQPMLRNCFSPARAAACVPCLLARRATSLPLRLRGPRAHFLTASQVAHQPVQYWQTTGSGRAPRRRKKGNSITVCRDDDRIVAHYDRATDEVEFKVTASSWPVYGWDADDVEEEVFTRLRKAFFPLEPLGGYGALANMLEQQADYNIDVRYLGSLTQRMQVSSG